MASAKRLMTDNHWSYTRNRSLRELLDKRRINHVRTPKRHPQPNGHQARIEPSRHAAIVLPEQGR
jgi:hypothetical protein